MADHDVAAELRARAEKARAKAIAEPATSANESYAWGRSKALDEVASLVEALRSPEQAGTKARVEAVLFDWLGKQEKPMPRSSKEWGPVCVGCGSDEFRIDGFCSIECRDRYEFGLEIRAALEPAPKQAEGEGARADFLHQGHDTPEEAFDLAPEVAAEKETPMPPNEPALNPANPDKPTTFTDEDRMLLRCWIEDRVLAEEQMLPEERASLTRALAYIDHLEGALESVCNVGDRAAVQVARAALPTSKEDAG